MTKEEAIKVLNQVRQYTDYPKEAFTMAIDALSQPSLPSNLDKAAEEYAYTNWEDNDYHTGASEGLPFDAIGHTEKCFKAGAEWMAGQGETREVVVKEDAGGYPYINKLELYDYDQDKPLFKAGDEVIVQIRKKQ